jgi:hypothetical protein
MERRKSRTKLGGDGFSRSFRGHFTQNASGHRFPGNAIANEERTSNPLGILRRKMHMGDGDPLSFRKAKERSLLGNGQQLDI